MSVLLGYRDFFKEQEIINFIINSKNFNPEKENPSDANALLIFQTSTQQTWLVFSKERIYCILDDIRKDEPNINWSMSKRRFIIEDQINLEINTRDKTEKTGLVDIGSEHTGWLFSKTLFNDTTIDKKIHQLINKTML